MIIAECCTNWRDMDEARRMITIAGEKGAGLVKFQLFDAEADRGEPHYDWVKAHELSFEQAKMLFHYGQSAGIEVFFSVFGPKFVDWCEAIGVKRYKLAASEVNNEVLWLSLADNIKEKIVSAPYGNAGFAHFGREKLTYLYCVPLYPAPVQAYNLQDFYKRIPASAYAGISDHTIGIDAAKIALARGAQIIEKHFVLEHDAIFPDDAWSMTPDDLGELVQWEKICRKVGAC